MIKDLHVVHRPKPRRFEAAIMPCWETCLRTLAFGSSNAVNLKEAQDEIFANAEAYRFVLEIICGLHSPILGETEVFGQFKQFVQVWREKEPTRAPLIQRWLMDAKEIRAQHLSGLGVQTYGSWIKRHLRQEPLHILGAGQLVQEILPHLQKKSDSIQLHVRNPGKVPGSVQILNQGFTGGSVVVAAPMKAFEIQAWMGNQPALKIFDLRDSAATDPLASHCARRVYRLDHIFAQIAATRASLQPVIETVRREILVRAQRVEAFAQIRPQGWDDLCA